MNNLLQSLASQRLKIHAPNIDIKRLLTTVRDTRNHDQKLTDAFYDSLEGVLHDLRAVTADNRDAEAFLKPVSRIDYPDYAETIDRPMDLQTMLKKVKAKNYKSKKEFIDDLDLIWDNCFRYNTGENHPLRLCAIRLREKSRRLLKSITDRKDRLDPPVSSLLNNLPPSGKTMINGHSRAHSSSASPAPGTNTPTRLKFSRFKKSPSIAVEGLGSSVGMNGVNGVNGTTPAATSTAVSISTAAASTSPQTQTQEADVPFSDWPAYTRTTEGMREYMRLDEELGDPGPSSVAFAQAHAQQHQAQAQATQGHSIIQHGQPVAFRVEEQLRGIIGGQYELDEGDLWDADLDIIVNGEIGEKRKLTNGVHPKSRKRARRSMYTNLLGSDPIALWWEASRSASMMTNFVPKLKFPNSNTILVRPNTIVELPSAFPPTPPSQSQLPTQPSIPAPPPTKSTPKKKRKTKSSLSKSAQQPKSLLQLMNNNIRTMKKVRRTHDKFLLLNLTSEENAAGTGGAGATGDKAASADPSIPYFVRSFAASVPNDDEELDVFVDERPWRVVAGLSKVTTGQSSASSSTLPPLPTPPIEIGEKEALDGALWTSSKVLEHAGFQGTSRVALEVFTGVMTEYLMNVGRTIRFFCDRYSKTMTPEEIILHTLFEGGITHIGDLERYIKDDVLRYGVRLSDLEKKLVNAYREITTVEALDDDALFGNDDEEEDSELVMGNFADMLGDDFLGLRELGIAAEYGMSNLTIPKRLLKGKKHGQMGGAQDGDKPKEKPLPYPLPTPFLILDSSKIDKQIGLLKNFYMQKVGSMATATTPTNTSMPPPPPPPLGARAPGTPLYPPGLPVPTTSPMSVPTFAPPGAPGLSSTIEHSQTPVVIPDDPPNPARVKIGPLGQIIKPSASAVNAAAKKKKAKGKDAGAGAGTGTAPTAATGPAVGVVNGIVTNLPVGVGAPPSLKTSLSTDGSASARATQSPVIPLSAGSSIFGLNGLPGPQAQVPNNGAGADASKKKKGGATGGGLGAKKKDKKPGASGGGAGGKDGGATGSGVQQHVIAASA